MIKSFSLFFAALAFPAFTATAQYIDPEAEDVDSVAVEVVEHFKIVSGRLCKQNPPTAPENLNILFIV